MGENLFSRAMNEAKFRKVQTMMSLLEYFIVAILYIRGMFLVLVNCLTRVALRALF